MTRVGNIPDRIPPSQTTSGEQAIPRILFQTFKSNEVPQSMLDAVMSWVNQNPEFEYRFFNDELARELINSELGSKSLIAYDSLPSGAYRADLWRYCTLFKFGGVYADIDTICKRPLSQLISVDDQFIVPRGNQPHFLFNAFICATPQHPFLSKVIEHALALIEQGDSRHPFGIVGPSALGQALNASVGASAMTPHRIGRQKKNGLSYRILRKFYSRNRILKNMVGRSRVLDGFSTVLLSSYEGYRADLRTMKVKHWSKKGRVPKNFGTGDLTSTVPEDYRSGIT